MKTLSQIPIDWEREVEEPIIRPKEVKKEVKKMDSAGLLSVIAGTQKAFVGGASIAKSALIIRKSAQQLAKETYMSTFPEFDLEQVFFRSVFGMGVFGALWAGYQVYKVIKAPDLAVGLGAIDMALDLDVNPVLSVLKHTHFLMPMTILQQAIKDLGLGDLTQSAKKAFKASKKTELAERLNIPSFIVDVFEDYSGHIVFGIPLVFIFLEYRKAKKIRELERIF